MSHTLSMLRPYRRVIAFVMLLCVVFSYLYILAPQTVTAADDTTSNPVVEQKLKDTNCAWYDVRCWVSELLLRVGATILWLAGILFNLVIKYTVVEMSTMVQNIGAIDAGWGTFRNLANIFFIFILTYIAISTILGTAGAATKGTLVKILVIALLINFSLFFTKAIIDASNVLALQFYRGVAGDTVQSDGGISWMFARAMRIQTLYSPNPTTGQGPTNTSVRAAVEKNVNEYLNSGNILLIAVGGFLVMIITAIVFFAGALMFVVRFVILVFLMVTAPMAWVAMVLPKADSIASKWWGALFNQIIFAPVFMMLIWFVASVVNSPGFLGGLVPQKGDLNAMLISGDPDSVALMLNFAIVISFLIATLIVSKSLGAWGAAAGLKAINAGSNWAKNKAISGSTWAPRYLGAIADRGLNKNLPESHWLRRWVTRPIAEAKMGGKESGTERLKRLGTWDKEAAAKETEVKARRDVEDNAKIIEELERIAGRTPEQNAALTEATQNLQSAVVKLSKPQMDAISPKVLAMRHVAEAMRPDQLDWVDESQKFSVNEKGAIFKSRRARYEEALAELQTNPDNAAAKKVIRDIEDGELAKLPPDLIDKAAQHMSYNQASAIYKSNKIAAWQKDAVRGKREAVYTEQAKQLEAITSEEKTLWEKGNSLSADKLKQRKELEERIQSISSAELKELSPNLLKEASFAQALSNSQSDEVEKLEKLSSSDKESYQKARLERINNVMQEQHPTRMGVPVDGLHKMKPDDVVSVRKGLQKMGAKWVNRLNVEVLKSDRMLEFYSPGILQRMAQEGLPEDKIKAIRDAVTYAFNQPNPSDNVKRLNEWLTDARSRDRF